MEMPSKKSGNTHCFYATTPLKKTYNVSIGIRKVVMAHPFLRQSPNSVMSHPKALHHVKTYSSFAVQPICNHLTFIKYRNLLGTLQCAKP